MKSEAQHYQLNNELSTKVLTQFAKKFNLFASEADAELALKKVQVIPGDHLLQTSFSDLFPGYSLVKIPSRLLQTSQLPALVITPGGDVGIINSLGDSPDQASIDWMTDNNGSDSNDSVPHGSDSNTLNRTELSDDTLILTVVPPAEAESAIVAKKEKGPATQAILVGIKANMTVIRKAAVVTVFINLIAILSSLFAMQVYDRVVPNFAYATLAFLAAGVGIAYILDLIFKFIRLGFLESSKKRLDEGLSLYFYNKLLALKLDKRPSKVGSLVAQVRDYESIKAFFSSSTLYAIGDLPFVFIFIGLIAVIGGPVALVPATFVLISIMIGLIVYRPMMKYQQDNNDASIRKQGLLFESVAGGEAIKSTGGEAKFSDKWLRVTQESVDKGEELTKIMSAAQFFTQFFQQLSFVGILVVGVFVIETGEMTMGALIACSILGGRTLAFISNISNLLVQWHNARYSLKILNQLLSTDSDDDYNRQSNTHSLPLDIQLNDVSFNYQGVMMPQLVVPKLFIHAGSRLAILGKNGSGKTTLLKLLAAVATPSNGQITVAGLDYEHCKPSWLRSEIGYLPQDVRLFSGTLLDNLTLGLSMPDEADIWAALEKTGLAPAVKAHPEGLMLPIYEGGSGLSGGQRQLVGLTRLVLQNPKIWILDEPSASLDSDAELKVVQLIKGLPTSTTIIFTTHKKSWLSLSERLLVIEAGQIALDQNTNQVQALSEEQYKQQMAEQSQQDSQQANQKTNQKKSHEHREGSHNG